MKGSGGVVASVIALSTAALSSSSSSLPPHPNWRKRWDINCVVEVEHQEHCSYDAGSELRKTNASQRPEKFEPRFDGLRFIETLVTAHR